MKKIVLACFIAVFVAGFSFGDSQAMAQNPNRQGQGQGQGQGRGSAHQGKGMHRADSAQRRADFKQLNREHITASLELTAAQSEKFWPIYDAFWAERKELHLKRKALIEQMENAKEITKKQINDLVALRTQETAVMNSYIAKFEKVISTHQVGRLFVAEDEMRTRLNVRHGNSPRQGQGPWLDRPTS